MDRARRAVLTALIVVGMIATAGASDGPGGFAALVATVGWPTSSLVVSEVQTARASALANRATAASAKAVTGLVIGRSSCNPMPARQCGCPVSVTIDYG